MPSTNTTNRPLAAVTGASQGIGYELAKELGNRGYDLVIASETDLINTAAENLRQTGADVTPVIADLATREGVDAFYRQLSSAGRPAEVVVLNAGTGVGGAFADTDLEAEIDMINLNVIGTTCLAKRVVKDMVAAGSGKLLFTASVASIAPGPYEAVYAATKAFVYLLAEGLRGELKDKGITVTALQPGATETNFFHRAGMDDTKVGQAEKDDPADVAKDGIDALFAGKDRVVAGSLKNSAFTAAARVAPTVAAEMHRKQAEPGSGKKTDAA